MATLLDSGDMIYWHGRTWLVDRVQPDNTLVLLDCYSRSRYIYSFPPISSVCFVATFKQWFDATLDETVTLQTRIETIRATNVYELPSYT